MAYHVAVEPAVVDFLTSADRELGPKALQAIFDFFEQVGQAGDRFLSEPGYRAAPGVLLIDFCLRDSRGRFRHFRFLVSDADAANGRLTIKYADEY